MEQSLIFRPFIATMILTLVVWVYMYARRIPFIARGKLTPAQLTPLEMARISPPSVALAPWFMVLRAGVRLLRHAT